MNENEASQVVSDLFELLHSPLLRYAAHLTASLELAEDIVQEAFTRLYRDLRRGHRIERPKAWLFCVVRRETGRHWREARAWGVMGGLEDLEDRGEPALRSAPDADRFLREDEVSRLLSVLSPREAEVVLLRLGNLTYREIGVELGLGVKSVGTLLARALRKLRRVLAGKPESEFVTGHVQKTTPRALQ